MSIVESIPLSEWLPEEPEETEVERTRRRIRQGRCPACGTPHRERRYRVCAACRDADRDYCPNCEHVRPWAEFRRVGDWCRHCDNAYDRRMRGYATPEDGKAAMVAGAARGNAAIRARVLAFGQQVDALKAQGVTTWQKLGEALGLPANTVRQRYYRYSDLLKEKRP